jgi:hypothetical protein
MMAAGDTPWQYKRNFFNFTVFFLIQIQGAYLKAVDFIIQCPITELAAVF